MIHDENYWSDRYISNQIQWDTGSITTPLKEYFDQLINKKLKILIPGCGNAYEAAYLWNQGFKNTYIADISSIPLLSFKKEVPDFPNSQLINKDFFNIQETFDLIVEQTFFCALHPSERERYVIQMNNLLKPTGKLVGLLFNDSLNTDHPPYGGSHDEYQLLFAKHLNILKMELCYNSIKPRAGRELFLIAKSKV